MSVGKRSAANETPGPLAIALRNMSYEVLPFKGTEQSVLDYVPTDVALTITATETKGLLATVELAERLSQHGYMVAPHLPARMLKDEAQLVDLVERLRAAGVRNLVVIGGDAIHPLGKFKDAYSLLVALKELGHSDFNVGIGGYPEGHAMITDEILDLAIAQKAPLATHVITQICFDARITTAWASRLKQREIDLPVFVGVPGPVSRSKLLTISAKVGLGESARFLHRQHNMFWRFFLPGGYLPNKLIEGFESSLATRDTNIVGFHIFTFNELEKTENWRKEIIREASGQL